MAAVAFAAGRSWHRGVEAIRREQTWLRACRNSRHVQHCCATETRHLHSRAPHLCRSRSFQHSTPRPSRRRQTPRRGIGSLAWRCTGRCLQTSRGRDSCLSSMQAVHPRQPCWFKLSCIVAHQGSPIPRSQKPASSAGNFHSAPLVSHTTVHSLVALTGSLSLIPV